MARSASSPGVVCGRLSRRPPPKPHAVPDSSWDASAGSAMKVALGPTSQYSLRDQRALRVPPPPTPKRWDCGSVSANATPGSSFRANSPGRAGRGSEAWAGGASSSSKAAPVTAAVAESVIGDLGFIVLSPLRWYWRRSSPRSDSFLVHYESGVRNPPMAGCPTSQHPPEGALRSSIRATHETQTTSRSCASDCRRRTGLLNQDDLASLSLRWAKERASFLRNRDRMPA